jgi:hypothetical protein
MAQDGRFFLLTDIAHLTALLQSGSLDERHEMAVRLLRAEAEHRLAERDSRGSPPADLLPPPATPLAWISQT